MNKQNFTILLKKNKVLVGDPFPQKCPLRQIMCEGFGTISIFPSEADRKCPFTTLEKALFGLISVPRQSSVADTLACTLKLFIPF